MSDIVSGPAMQSVHVSAFFFAFVSSSSLNHVVDDFWDRPVTPSWGSVRRSQLLRYESSTLILYKELSSSIFQSLSVSERVSQASVREPFKNVLADFVC